MKEKYFCTVQKPMGIPTPEEVLDVMLREETSYAEIAYFMCRLHVGFDEAVARMRMTLPTIPCPFSLPQYSSLQKPSEHRLLELMWAFPLTREEAQIIIQSQALYKKVHSRPSPSVYNNPFTPGSRPPPPNPFAILSEPPAH